MVKNNKRYLLIFFLLAAIFLTSIQYVSNTFFQSHKAVPQEQVKGKVITSDTISQTQDKFQTFTKQNVQVMIREEGRPQQVSVIYDTDSLALQPLRPGDEILLTKTTTKTETVYLYAGKYRLERLLLIVAGFLLLVYLAAGKKGLGALAGLAVSTLVIVSYIIPQILTGADPLHVTLTGAMVIMLVSVYLAHGVSKQTTVALVATLLAFLFTYVLSSVLVNFAMLSGFGSEDAYNVYQPENNLLQIKALLISGILIATLGALDDVTTAQSAAVFELSKANSKLPFRELVKRGMTIGREHMVSLINTLIIAYIGSSLMLFVSYFIFYKQEFFLAVLNREPIAEAIVKTIAISSGLVLALPIVTVLAAYVVIREREQVKKKT